MRRFQVTVNGTAYDVTVEELNAAAPVASATPAPAPAAPVAPAAKAAPAPAGGTPVAAPMPGTVNRINVKAGDSVKKGDVLLILEAMKMENDICAPADGKVLALAVGQGDSVNTDQVLLTIG